jgi:hypothetical protein
MPPSAFVGRKAMERRLIRDASLPTSGKGAGGRTRQALAAVRCRVVAPNLATN